MSDEAAEERVRALEDEVRRLSAMLEGAPDFITRITVDGKFLYLNRLAPGYDMTDVLGTSVDAYVRPEFRELARTAIRIACETRTVQEYATLGSTGVGSVGHYLTRVSPIIEDGQVTSLVMIATDVTALEQNRVRLQLALNATGLGIWTSERGGAASWDRTTREIFGLSPDAPIPPLDQVLRERIFPEDRGLITEALECAELTGHYGPIEHRIVRTDGEVRWVAASGVAVVDPKGDLVRIVGSMQDITHRRALEARLLEAEKLESVGRLAGGVAHDFNNMLTVILANVDMASRARTLDEAKQVLGELRVTAERSAALTAQLLAFARRRVIEPQIVDPKALVTRLCVLLERVIGAQIDLVTELRSSYRVRADASQLEQVVLNLVTNARDSMPRGGRVLLRTADREIGAAQDQPELPMGSYVCIAVTDSGGGIAADHLRRIFEPFFTTRQGGTGLGLATCYGIVKQAGGHIEVTSQLGKGTTFTVYLPRAAGRDVDETTAGGGRGPVGTGRGERVLVVEDEELVRSVVERSLSAANYRVVVAARGDEALVLAESQGPFDLLITDAVMPGMTGWELGQRVAARWPGLRVLYMSGYTEQIVTNGGAIDPGLQFLQKPFGSAALLEAVERALGAPRAAPR
jgi:two-component system, cell cycle sensor histidine kinase and response regulator CckA